MPYEFLDDQGGVLLRLPASVWLAQRHVGGSPRARFVRGYGSTDWFITRDGIREPETVDLVGSLATDRDESGTQALIDQLVTAANNAVALAHVGLDDQTIEVLPLLGALPIITAPDGIDGSIVRVTLPLIPGGEWGEPPPPPEHDYLLLDSGGVMLLDTGGRAIQQ